MTNTNTNTKTVTVEEQRAMGLLRNQNQGGPKLVPATFERTKTQPVPLPVNDSIMVNVTPTATSHIDMRTSAQDRAIGFLIASVPRTFAISLAVAIAGIVLAGWSLAVSLVVLFGLFSIVELASYVFTLLVSAEGTAHYEARMKWAILRTEQRERWAHYKKITGG